MLIREYGLKRLGEGNLPVTAEVVNEFDVIIDSINNPTAAITCLRQMYDIDSLAEENVFALYLNIHCEPVGVSRISVGTTSHALLMPKDIILRALLLRADCILLVHNHLYKTDPSKADLESTKSLNQSCNELGLRLIDHIIVADHGMYSLAAEGLMSSTSKDYVIRERDGLSFTEFCDYMVDEVSKCLELDVKTEFVAKRNDHTYTGLNIGSENVRPLVRMEDFYKEYVNGLALEGIVESIIDIYERARDCGAELSDEIEGLSSFEDVKDKIRLMVLNTEANKLYLEDVLHTDFLDLSIVPYIEVNKNATASIRNGLMKSWGIAEAEIFNTGYTNMLEHGVRLCSMDKMISEISGLPIDACECVPSTNLMVLTSESGLLGSGYLVISEVLYDIAKKLGSDLFIIPSSVHELIIMPADDAANSPTELRRMIREVNDSVVSEEDILSYSLYGYSRETNKVRIIE